MSLRPSRFKWEFPERRALSESSSLGSLNGLCADAVSGWVGPVSSYTFVHEGAVRPDQHAASYDAAERGLARHAWRHGASAEGVYGMHDEERCGGGAGRQYKRSRVCCCCCSWRGLRDLVLWLVGLMCKLLCYAILVVLLLRGLFVQSATTKCEPVRYVL